MKKIMSIIVLAALLTAALVVFVCESPEFNNPLDEKGTNFLENRDSAKAHKDEALATDENGVAMFWADNTEKFRPNCDDVTPTIALVGASQININTQQVQEFRKWMHFDDGQWAELITWGKGPNGKTEPVPKEPCLKRGTGDCMQFSAQEKNRTPDPNNYIIEYKVEKPLCRGATPYATVNRTLNVTQFIAVDTGRPVITVTGGLTAEVRVGNTYTDMGATVNIGQGGPTNPGALDSVVVKGTNSGNTYSQTVRKPAAGSIDFTSIVVPTTTANSTFSITYYASYRGNDNVVRTSTAIRNVKVLEQQQSNVAPIIVLKPYKLKVPSSGKIIDYPDTMIYLSSATNDSYREKGVDRVYYVSGGNETTVCSNGCDGVVTTTRQPSFITGQNDPARKTVTYEIPAGTGYASGAATRNVFLVYTEAQCVADEIAPVAPIVRKATATASNPNSDTIPAGVIWKYDDTWTVTHSNALGSAGFKYMIDFNGLDPYKPVPKSGGGGYEITYVGLGKCGETAELKRTIFVKP
ncbi:MAG: hypothetical protein LBC59_08315 [Chitinispirillales bacterium]|jgi:hypothetical protein|nr:hypothetical protein [Chitinispirillales bacterium]